MTNAQTIRLFLLNGPAKNRAIVEATKCTPKQVQDALKNLRVIGHVTHQSRTWSLTDIGVSAANGSGAGRAKSRDGLLKCSKTLQSAGAALLQSESWMMSGSRSDLATKAKSGRGKQRLEPQTVAMLEAVRLMPLSLRQMLDKFSARPVKTVSGTLNRLRQAGYVDGAYMGGVFRYSLSATGKFRLAENATMPVKAIRKPRNQWEPNVSRRIGDLGGLMAASVWAYAQQVGA